MLYSWLVCKIVSVLVPPQDVHSYIIVPVR